MTDSKPANESPAVESPMTSSVIAPRMSRRQRWVTVMFSGCAFLVTYVGLAGPMSALHRTVQDSPWQRCIEVVFYPVVFVVKNDIEPLATLIKAWCGLFR